MSCLASYLGMIIRLPKCISLNYNDYTHTPLSISFSSIPFLLFSLTKWKNQGIYAKQLLTNSFIVFLQQKPHRIQQGSAWAPWALLLKVSRCPTSKESVSAWQAVPGGLGSHSARPGSAAEWCREEAGNMLWLEGRSWGLAAGSGRGTSATWLSSPTTAVSKEKQTRQANLLWSISWDISELPAGGWTAL